ncbi:MAG: hypothetical protein JXA21_28975 [Anaerolineae bacterium]|nr:hypothetical protein [Anaerolineae bacterium]
MGSFRKRYIRLGTNMLVEEQRALEHSIREALQPTWPADLFVSELERELMEEARQQTPEPRRMLHGLGVFGLVGGGLLSIAGGVLMWVLLRQNRPTTTDAASRPAKLFSFVSPKLTKTPPLV